MSYIFRTKYVSMTEKSKTDFFFSKAWMYWKERFASGFPNFTIVGLKKHSFKRVV